VVHVTRAALVKQADVERALRAAKAVGMKPTSFRVDSDGSVQVSFLEGQGETGNSFDNMMSGIA
jgi:hypothetical protein